MNRRSSILDVRPKSNCGFVRGFVWVALVGFLCVTVPPARSQGESNEELKETVRKLAGQVQQLQGRVSELEGNRMVEMSSAGLASGNPLEMAPAISPGAPSPASSPVPAQEAGHSMEIPGGPVMHIRGFSDADFVGTNQKGVTNTFAIGALDMFVTSKISEKFSMLSEINFEAGEDNGMAVDLERLLLTYSANDHFQLSFGRYHTAIGYYNTAFHHGTWFQTATGRPLLFFFEDGGGPLPVHNVGMSLTGTVPSGKLDLHYIAEIGNGRPARTPQNTTVQNSQDENNGKSFNLGFYARPDWASGLQFGASVYYDHLIPNALTRVHEYIPAVHIVYITPKFEFMNEGVWIRHQVDNGGRVYNSPGFYTQISRQWAKYRPYFRYQYVNISATEPVLADIGRQDGPSVGLRYEWSDFAAFKIQYDRNYRRGLQDYDSVSGQMAFTF